MAFRPRGPNLIGPTRAWTQEIRSRGDARRIDLPSTFSGLAPNVGLEVRGNAGPDWHVQLHQVGLDLVTGETYTVWALGPDGQRKAKVPAGFAKGRLTFRADPKYRTL